MTALKAIEWRDVRGVPSTSYPTNLICAHPQCNELVPLRPSGKPTVHHIFPRSTIGNDSYFVQYTPENGETKIVPHAVGLCGSGTTGHHGDVEEHRAWIKLEDGEFRWYERVPPTDPHDEIPADWQEWQLIGALNPQPGSVDGKPKRKRTVKGSSERAARKTVSIRLPEGVDGDYWDDLTREAEEVELSQPDTQFDPARGAIALGKLVVTVFERYAGRVG